MSLPHQSSDRSELPENKDVIDAMKSIDDGNGSEQTAAARGNEEGTNEAAAFPKPGDIYIGTAGYNYPHWRSGVFYPRGLSQSSELRHYSGVFPSVEINNTFHGIPSESTVISWTRDAKKGFRFGLKVPQEITHGKRLANFGETWETFLDRARCMNEGQDSLAPILFQLPPSLPKDVSKLEALSKVAPRGLKVAFEFRNASWYCDEVYETLRRREWAICENVSPDDSAIRSTEVTASFCYARFHKRGDRLETDYSDEQLKSEADKIVAKRCEGLTQYIYFLNDHEGNAPKNAKTLMRFISQRIDPLQNSFSFVSGWKADHVIEKGGKGSIESMFANAREKATRKPPGDPEATITSSQSEDALNCFLSPTKRKKTSLRASSKRELSKSPLDAKTGKITSFFCKK